MVTADLKEAFTRQRLPASFKIYSQLLRRAPTEETPPFEAGDLESTQWKFLSPDRLVLLGPASLNRWAEPLRGRSSSLSTASTHIAVQAVLDLACLQNFATKSDPF
jgi:hypothetical protein